MGRPRLASLATRRAVEALLANAPPIMTPAQAAAYIWPAGHAPKNRRWIATLEHEGTMVRGTGRRIRLVCRRSPKGRIVYRTDLCDYLVALQDATETHHTCIAQARAQDWRALRLAPAPDAVEPESLEPIDTTYPPLTGVRAQPAQRRGRSQGRITGSTGGRSRAG